LFVVVVALLLLLTHLVVFYRNVTEFKFHKVIKVNEIDEMIVFKIKGQSFMYHQIRKMVGMVLAVALGNIPIEVHCDIDVIFICCRLLLLLYRIKQGFAVGILAYCVEHMCL